MIDRFRWLMLLLGPMLGLAAYAVMPDSFLDEADRTVLLDHAARAAAGMAVWMAVWWLSEAVPISVTALVPLAAFPLLGIGTMAQTGASYGNPIVFLFFGGFVISLAMQKWGLHRRFALWTIRLIGTKPRRLVLGFMAASAALSLWISNTATTMMMLPIALSVLDRLGIMPAEGDQDGQAKVIGGEIGGEMEGEEMVVGGEGGARDGGPGQSPAAGGGAIGEGLERSRRNLAVSLMLGIAYAASIGGLGTPLGSPPNFIARAYFDQQGLASVSFPQWMMLAMPIVIVFIPITWYVLTSVVYPVGRGEAVDGGRAEGVLGSLGPMNRGEWFTAGVFIAAVAAWVSRGAFEGWTIGSVAPFRGAAGDAVIAMLAALALFVLPVSLRPRRFVIDWASAVRLPWGVLILFGGGLALAGALAHDPDGARGLAYGSLSAFLAAHLESLRGVPPIVMVGATVALVIFLTELTSNTATATTIVPILGAMAVGMGIAPHDLVMPAALAATCAFMLPVGTPPNAIVYASGHIRMSQMVRAGVFLNLIGVLLITLIVYWLMPMVLGE